MSNYSKLIGSVIGGLLGFLVSKYGLPAELNSPDVITGLTGLACALGTYIAPANKPQ